MEDRRSIPNLKRAGLTEASTSTKRPRHEVESESPVLLPTSDLPEKIHQPSVSGANSGPSTSSTSMNGDNYNVFLSFRGPDTRKGFVDHLYHRLENVGLRILPDFVFRDDKDIPFGEEIAAKLNSAIRHSKVSIPVISPNYAASEWCLHELIEIMKCKETSGQIVLTVLYKVNTSEVRHLKGSFGEAFKSGKEDVKEQALEALRKALECRVFESEKFASGHEAELVDELVRIVQHKQQKEFQRPLPEILVGIDYHVNEVMKLVDPTCPDTRVVGIWGMSGIGKTTLAKIIYNKLSPQFRYHCFLKDIRETSEVKGIDHVQSRLISDIIDHHDFPVRDSDIGINMIQCCCAQKVVFILLDDVEHHHLESLIGRCDFKLGSRILFTCRDKALLKPEYKMYEIKEMNLEDSLLLFIKHAFEGKEPPAELGDLPRSIVATTGGLPLALEVIGSLLKGKKDQEEWKEMLKKLSKAPHMTVQKKLRISFDSLKQYGEKEMFLDIACFLVGTDKTIATYMWKDRNLSPIGGLQILLNRSLIKIGDENRLRMHDQLKDLGRAIACPPGEKRWKCSRLWDEEAMTILGRKKVNEEIKALRLDGRGSREFMERGSFKRMPCLEFLHLTDVNFVGDFEDSLSELRWLKWEECPDSFQATNVHLGKLLILDLSYGSTSETWEGWSSIKVKNLKVLNLLGCSRLKSTPNLSAFKILEMLLLEKCWDLEEIDPSIGDLTCLTSLNLRWCVSLRKLPSRLGELKRLVSLDLWACEALKELPGEVDNLEELKELIIGVTAIKKIPFIGSLKKLEMLNAYGCMELVELPDSISCLINLSTLDLRICSSLGRLPENIGSLVKLQRLLLSKDRTTEYLDGHSIV